MSGFGTIQSLKLFLAFVRDESDCLRAIREKLSANQDLTAKTVYHLLHALIDSADSLVLLAERKKARDSLVVGRVVFETALTTLFVWTMGDDVAARAWKYAHARAYRDLNRSLAIGGQALVVEWQGKVDLANNPELDKAVKAFTTSSGREIRRWTPESLRQQIELLHDRYGQPVSFAFQGTLLTFYGSSSEIAHGSLFAALSSQGLIDPLLHDDSPTEDQLEKKRLGQLSVLLLMLGLCLSRVAIIVGRDIHAYEEATRAQDLFNTAATTSKEIDDDLEMDDRKSTFRAGWPK